MSSNATTPVASSVEVTSSVGSTSFPLSLTAASSSTAPTYTSVTWGGLSDSTQASAQTSSSSSSSSTTAPTTSSASVVESASSQTSLGSSETSEAASSILQQTSSTFASATSTNFASASTTDSSTWVTSSSSQTTQTSSSDEENDSTAGSSWSQITSQSVYTSDGNVVTVKYTSSDLVPITQATTVWASGSTAAAATTAALAQNDSGTPTSTKIAVGVVVPVGALSLLAIGFYYLRRRKNVQQHVALGSESVSSEEATPHVGDTSNAHHMF